VTTTQNNNPKTLKTLIQRKFHGEQNPRRGNKKVKYRIALPDIALGIPRYLEMPHESTTIATSRSGAVSSYIFREGRNSAKLIIYVLKQRCGEDLAQFAHAIEDLADDIGAQDQVYENRETVERSKLPGSQYLFPL